MIKKYVTLLAIPAALFIAACGGSAKQENAEMPGMTKIDLTDFGMTVSLFVPDTTKNHLEIHPQTWGAIELKSGTGKEFHISVAPGEGDFNLKKSDISGDDINKFKRFVVDEPTAILWESQITDPEFHFYTVVKTTKESYVLEDVRGEQFSESSVKKMLEAAKSLTATEVATAKN